MPARPAPPPGGKAGRPNSLLAPASPGVLGPGPPLTWMAWGGGPPDPAIPVRAAASVPGSVKMRALARIFSFGQVAAPAFFSAAAGVGACATSPSPGAGPMRPGGRGRCAAGSSSASCFLPPRACPRRLNPAQACLAPLPPRTGAPSAPLPVASGAKSFGLPACCGGRMIAARPGAKQPTETLAPPVGGSASASRSRKGAPLSSITTFPIALVPAPPADRCGVINLSCARRR